jgi:DNA-binding response OmpR family regulator
MTNDGLSSDLILVVEDDSKTASLITLYLQREGYETAVAHDGEEALRLTRLHSPIFVILDLMLPKIDGWQVCSKIRDFSNVPILILTARGEEFDRVVGLTIGADDYMVKPFSPRELVARVRAILRRAKIRAGDDSERLIVGELTLDLQRHKLMVTDHETPLTPSEFKLLRLFMNAPGRLFTREQLLEALYPRGEEVVDRVVDVHVGKLRQKIERDPTNPRYILTVRGFGYRFAEDDPR